MATINTNKVNETNTTPVTPMGGVGLRSGRDVVPQIFRYKLSDNIMTLITQFAKTHQYDDRHSYKDAWLNQWLNDYGELVEREISRLQQLGYKGDVIDKMFKAGRYYFREKESLEKKKNKSISADGDDEEREEKSPRTYCVMKPDVIKVMDNHLLSIMREPNFKPANGYKQFCEQYMELLWKEIARLIQEQAISATAEKLAEKIKKTYKNRYYILSKQ